MRSREAPAHRSLAARPVGKRGREEITVRMTYLSLGAVAVSALVFSGCKSTPYQGQRDLVEDQLDEAKDAGASKGEIQQVRETVKQAESEEKRAAKDQKEARDDLAWARNELPAAQSRANEFQRRKAQIDDELARVRDDMAAIEREQNDLTDRGLTSEQVSAIVGVRRGLLIKRQAELQTEADTVNSQLQLAQLDRQAAEQYMEAAQHRLDAAQARVTLASQLYTLADQQGRTLQAEALRARRGELGEQIYLTPSEEAFEPTTQPTGIEQGSQPAGFQQPAGGEQPR